MRDIVTTSPVAVAPEMKRLQRAMAGELLALERQLQELPELESPLRELLGGILRSGGKRLRPRLALLAYRLGGGSHLPVRPLLCMLELMHTASLIHDDVVDGAALRRNAPTINAVHGEDWAIRLGDFLLSQAMTHLHVYRGTMINEVLVQASSDMCLGELLQLGASADWQPQTEAHYFLQIYRKTASLIAASCMTGALAGGMSVDAAQPLWDYGENLGLAFQLRDDLLDMVGDKTFGKEAGRDIKNGIRTLPIIYMVQRGLPAELLAMLHKENKSAEEIALLLACFKSEEALSYTRDVIGQKTTNAIKALEPYPESPEKTALITLAQALAERDV